MRASSPSGSGGWVTGTAAGLAILAKTTWLVLLMVWPGLVIGRILLLIRSRHRTQANGQCVNSEQSILDMTFGSLLIAGAAFTCLHSMYPVHEWLRPLGEFEFVGSRLRGFGDTSESRANAFRGTLLDAVPSPLPASFLLGIDAQWREFENPGPSFLCGEWSSRGWWYFYLYGLAVKCSHGSQCLLVLSVPALLRCCRREVGSRLLVCLLPQAVIFLLVSSENSFTHHVRYVIPTWAGACIVAGGTARLVNDATTFGVRYALAIVCLMAVAHAAWSVWVNCRDPIACYNELAGGPDNGFHHLLFSNTDWGQSDPPLNAPNRSLLRRLYIQKVFPLDAESDPLDGTDDCYVSVQYMKGGPFVNTRLADGRTVVLNPQRLSDAILSDFVSNGIQRVSLTHFRVDDRIVEDALASPDAAD